jgi:hypothetical protein
MLLSATLTALSAAYVATARTLPVKRSTTDLGELYAYGLNITGLPLIYGDGVAYVASQAPPDVQSITTMNCEML